MSKTSNLPIDAVTPDNCRGRIGMVICPGRKIGHAIGGDWDRDLEEDLMAILDWGARLLVTLMQGDEMTLYGVAALPDKTRQLGMSYYHLPIIDMDVPDRYFEQQWQTTG